MAYRIEKEENGTKAIIIDGFEQGIADAPEQGIAFMRNANIVSIPGEACVNFSMSSVSVPPTGVSGDSVSFTGSTDIVTWTPTGTLYSGVAVTFGSTTGGVTAGTIYWITLVSASTFKVYTSIVRGAGELVDLSDASNTLTVITFGTPSQKALDYINSNIFILDTSGRAWWVNGAGVLVYIGNTTLTSTHGNGLCVLGAYLFVFRDSAADYLPITELSANNAPAWVYSWGSISGLATSAASNYSHFAYVSNQNGGMHFCNNRFIGRLLPIGSGTFDPTNTNTFTYTSTAPSGGLPITDSATCLADLGGLILVGGIQNKVYPWDGLSTFFNSPLILSENYTKRIVSSNSNAYVFAGNRGRISITNGANVQIFKKIPDHIVSIFSTSNGIEPYYSWLDASYWKNQLYFSFTVSKNDGTAITNMGGIWALDLSTNPLGTSTSVGLRVTNILTTGAAGFPYLIIPNIRSTTPAGAGLYAAYVNAVSTAIGVDVTQSTPYASLGASVDIYTDLVPTGTNLTQKTFSQIEFKLAQPLVSGEQIRISMRQDFSEAFTVAGTTTLVGALSDVYDVNVQRGQWVQLYVETCSTSSSPSFTRLKELRIR